MDRREFLKKSMLLTAGAMVGGSLFSEATLSAAQSGSAAGKKKNDRAPALFDRGRYGQRRRRIVEKNIGHGVIRPPKPLHTETVNSTAARPPNSARWPKTSASGSPERTSAADTTPDGKTGGSRLCDAQAAVGGKYIVLPGIDFGKTEADLKRTCEYFDKVGAIANAAGLKFGYHNHAHEFNKQDGYVIENYLLEHTDPEKVMFELDVYWASKGGVNPSAYIQKYAGRFPLLHIRTTMSSEPARPSTSKRSSMPPTNRARSLLRGDRSQRHPADGVRRKERRIPQRS